MFKKFLAMALGIFLFGVGQANAGGAVYCVNCSNYWTQMLERITNIEELKVLYLEYGEAIQQTAHQLKNIQQNVEMITDMVHNTAALPRQIISKISDEMTRFAQITNTINTIRADIEGLEKVKDEYYKTKDEIQKLVNVPNSMLTERNVAIRASIDKMAERIDEATEATFKLSGSQLKDLEERGKTEDYINDLINNAEGRNGMLQAANQLAKLQYSEMQQMRELVATTVQSNLATQMRDEQQRQVSEEIADKVTTFKDEYIVLQELPMF
jgi:P-type conjugative transfer protein TrbJ